MPRLTPEATAQKVYDLQQAGNAIKAHGLRLKFEEQASEQDYEDYRYAAQNLTEYGVC